MSTGLDGYPVDRPDVTDRVLWTSARVLTASVTMFFSAFVFAFAYLKAQNTRERWNPGAEVSVAFGSVVLAAALLSAVAYWVAVSRLRDDDTSRWVGWAVLSLALGFTTIGLHIWQLDSLPFAARHGGYASVYVSWTVALIVVELGAMYWLYTVVRGALRISGTDDPYDEGPPAHVAHLVASARGYRFFWTLVVIIEAIAYVLLVLVR